MRLHAGGEDNRNIVCLLMPRTRESEYESSAFGREEDNDAHPSAISFARRCVFGNGDKAPTVITQPRSLKQVGRRGARRFIRTNYAFINTDDPFLSPACLSDIAKCRRAPLSSSSSSSSRCRVKIVIATLSR